MNSSVSCFVLFFLCTVTKFSSDNNMKVFKTHDGKVAAQGASLSMVVSLFEIDSAVYFDSIAILVPPTGYTTRGIMGKSLVYSNNKDYFCVA